MRSNRLTVSVIVCTLNRADNLRGALQSLLGQSFPADSCEIIVVDNGSTDHTQSVVEELRKTSHLSVKYIREPEPGLSFARNTGITQANGEIIAFIDDDAIADQSWLSHLVKVYEEESEAGSVGGRIIPKWSVPKPLWWHPDLDEVFNAVHYSESRSVAHYPRLPYGTNISFRSDVLKKVGGFRTDLGRIGVKLLAGEETDLCLRIECMGAQVYYEPQALVYHRVEPSKLTKKFIRKRAFGHGKSHAMIELEHFGNKYVLRRIVFLTPVMIWWTLMAIFSVTAEKHLSFFAGYSMEGILRRLVRTKR